MSIAVALHPEGVDRNPPSALHDIEVRQSPSTRRAWIEIDIASVTFFAHAVSPSTRRAWIEILCIDIYINNFIKSPSTRRAWIEII